MSSIIFICFSVGSVFMCSFSSLINLAMKALAVPFFPPVNVVGTSTGIPAFLSFLFLFNQI